MSRVLIGRNLPESVLAEARKIFDVTYRDSPYPLSHAEMVEALTEYDGALVTLGDAFNAEVFAEAGVPRARILANFGVGYNHIDVEVAKRAGLTVTNTPGAVTDATSDIAMTLMLMSCRRARRTRAKKWLRCRAFANALRNALRKRRTPRRS